MINSTSRIQYEQVPVEHFTFNSASLALRVWGEGDPIVFVHGFGVHGYTWFQMLPAFTDSYKCYVIDLPGFGDSEWEDTSDLSFTAQSKRLTALFERLDLKNLSIVAQDTGASIARMAALSSPDRVENLVVINSEIPHHRPPFIQMYQFLAKLPLSNLIFRTLLKSKTIVKSPLMFGSFFHDKGLFDDDERVTIPYVERLRTKREMAGMMKYLKGVEWKEVDDFEHSHQRIKANTLLLWGEKDVTFPLKLAKKMISQFAEGRCQLEVIENACLMPHEEKPKEVARAILDFFQKNKT